MEKLEKMHANFKYRVNSITGNTLQLPVIITPEFDMAGQTDLIINDFVKAEKKKAINEIVDYEKVRFVPANLSNNKLKEIEFKLHFYDGTSHTNITWDSIGFTQEDLVYKKNRFKKSFLRLIFYDSPNLLAQNALFYMTYFPQIDPTVQPNVLDSIRFKRQNPITNLNGFAEGFYIYFYKDLVPNGTDYELYARAEFLNAADGIRRPLMVYNGVPAYDSSFKDIIQFKYILRKHNEDYLYIIDNSNGEVIYGNEKVIINLYESVVQ